MKPWIILFAHLNAALLIMHEFDAIYRKEWRMFKFLRIFSERTRIALFVWVHLPLLIFLFFYLGTVLQGTSMALWVGVNIFSVVHLAVHLLATTWDSNVFNRPISFAIISIYGLSGGTGLLLYPYY